MWRQAGTSAGGAARRGIVVAGLRGGSGKSAVAVGLVAAWTSDGHAVTPFKKGPDYIDAGWLSVAAGRPCRNLDPFLMTPETIRASFAAHAGPLAVIEGNRGLFDGVDAAGSRSTAELAKMLDLPVLLVVDCTKATRTVAALVLGCRALDPEVRLIGVVGNRLGTGRQRRVIAEALREYTDVPFLGGLPRMAEEPFPMRHLGVIPFQEHGAAPGAVAALAATVRDHLDISLLLERICPLTTGSGEKRPETPHPAPGDEKEVTGHGGSGRVRIGVMRDAAFQFYYPENLEALEAAGAELVAIDALHHPDLPAVDGLYIGGGFPETSIAALADNSSLRRDVRRAAEEGMPVYAECGGLIYLCRSLEVAGVRYPLAGVFPVDLDITRRPQAHGYSVLRVEGENPFYPVGTEIRGHEFRYSRVLAWEGEPGRLPLRVVRGTGFAGRREGLAFRNVLALYTHVHALGTPEWAPAFVARARAFRGKV